MNNPLKYTHPSGWLKYYNIDGDWRETSYTTWYGIDWVGPFNIIEGEGVWVTYKNGELIK